MPDENPDRAVSRLWLWIVLAFGIQFAAWTAWFIVAAHHHVEEVPLVGAPSHP
jgi:hypothetical protein